MGPVLALIVGAGAHACTMLWLQYLRRCIGAVLIPCSANLICLDPAAALYFIAAVPCCCFSGIPFAQTVTFLPGQWRLG